MKSQLIAFLAVIGAFWMLIDESSGHPGTPFVGVCVVVAWIACLEADGWLWVAREARWRWNVWLFERSLARGKMWKRGGGWS